MEPEVDKVGLWKESCFCIQAKEYTYTPESLRIIPYVQICNIYAQCLHFFLCGRSQKYKYCREKNSVCVWPRMNDNIILKCLSIERFRRVIAADEFRNLVNPCDADFR